MDGALEGWMDWSSIDWRARLLCMRSVSSGTSSTFGLGTRMVGRGTDEARDGWRDSSSRDLRASSLWMVSDSSGTSITDGCLGFMGPPLSIWTSASFGSRAGKTSSRAWLGSGTGFESLGSWPAFNALAMRRAWYLAYLILAAFSDSISPQFWSRSKKVAAA
jgi:hypothetical protein